MDVSSFMGRRNAAQGLVLWKSGIGTPERCPLDLCRSVSAPTVTGASINEDARSLIENAPSLSQDAPAPRPDPHSLRLDPRSFRPDHRSLLADGRSLRENARARPRRTPNWPSPRHTIGINGHSSEIEEATPGLEERTLPLEGASLRIERSSLRPIPSSLFIRSRACHPERRARLCAWRSAIVRHQRVAKDLLFSYLCRSSLYAGADIGQKEIPVRFARWTDRRHRVAGRQGRPRSEAVLRG